VTAHGFLDTNGVITAIDIPDIHASSAHAINDLGQIVLGGDTYDGFLYSNGVFTAIHIPGARNTYLYGINDAGQIVGFGVRGGILDPVDGFIPISIPDAQYTIPTGINNAGQIVGQFDNSSGIEHGFVATPVPETSSLGLIASGLAAALVIGRRRLNSGHRSASGCRVS
jgi:probable HAF family extracellular repeat protein